MRRLFVGSVPREATVIVCAALAYGLLGQMWMRAAYPPSGYMRPSAFSAAVELALAAVFVGSILMAAVSADRSQSTRKWLWVRSSILTAILGLLSGRVLFMAGERLWWKGFSGGCDVGLHGDPGGRQWADAVCFLPRPLEHASAYEWGWPLFWLGAVVIAVFVGALGISLSRRHLTSRLNSRGHREENSPTT